MKLLGKFFSFFIPKSQRELEELFLSQATDLVDLERRQRVIQQWPSSNWY